MRDPKRSVRGVTPTKISKEYRAFAQQRGAIAREYRRRWVARGQSESYIYEQCGKMAQGIADRYMRIFCSK